MASKDCIEKILIESEQVYLGKNYTVAQFEQRINIFTRNLEKVSDDMISKFWQHWQQQKKEMFMIPDVLAYYKKREIPTDKNIPQSVIDNIKRDIARIKDSDLEPERDD